MTQTASNNSDVNIHDVTANDDDSPRELHSTNGHKSEQEVDGEPPSKRRRVSEVTPARKASPPWKKIVAEGPSSFTQDGIRKSGRVNHIPLELQPPSDKRTTRGAIQKTYSAQSKHGKTNKQVPQEAPTTTVNGVKKSNSTAAVTTPQSPKSPSKFVSPKRSHHRKSVPSEDISTPKRSHKKQSTSKIPHSAPIQARTSKSRRSGRMGESVDDEAPTPPQLLKKEEIIGRSPRATLSKIRFRVKPATLTLTHPALVLQRPRQYSTLREFLELGQHIHIDAGGLYHPDESSGYSLEQTSQDAKVIIRAEVVAQPGGVLSYPVCSAYQPERLEPLPAQYAHADHMYMAAFEFRRLMVQEERKHRGSAKKLAEACRDEWYRRQPKTSEQLEAEQVKASQSRFRSLMRTLQATWENVRTEVNRRRVLEWEAQEQARIRKALTEAVDSSTQLLQARRAHMDGDEMTDEDEDNGSEESDNAEQSASSSSDSEEHESNMSSSESEADEEQPRLEVAEDEHLSVEQLREKYATLPSMPSDLIDEEMVDSEEVLASEPDHKLEIEEVYDESDESVDMDDDMGSSDEEGGSDEDNESDEDEGEDEEEGGETTLLGFLAPAELKAVGLRTVAFSDTPGEYAASGKGEDDVSMIQVEASDEPSGEELAASIPAEPVAPTMDSPKPSKQSQHENNGGSPDRSSQPTPRTTETRPSEVDSAFSVELHEISRQLTEDVSPQPGNQLKTPVPFLLRGTLREYQHYGLDWLAGLYANNTNGILADEMGLGKTIQTIALLAHLACEHQVWGPHLVIVPTSVMLNWEMEFKKFLPGFKILTYYGTPEERKKKRMGWKSEDSWNVCITSYHIVLQDQQVFKRRQWHYMILDEAHNIKNFNSQRWQAMLTFNTRARLLLTGTPLQNNLTELWSLLYFLMPSDGTGQGVGGFADLKEFQDWFKKPSEQILEHGRDQMDDESRLIIAKLHKLLRPYLLRRLKADVEKQMPGKYEHVEFCRLSKRQRELYDGFLSRDDTRGTLAGGNYLSIINCLMQLRKVCNHPDLFVERAIMTSFPMEKSAIADFEIKELLVRRQLLREGPMTKVSLDFLNLVPTNHERFSGAVTSRSAILSAQRVLMDMREAQRSRAQGAFTNLDPSTTKSNLVYLESASRWGRFEELQHCVYLNALRRQQKPIYGSQVLDLLTLDSTQRVLRPKPRRRDQVLNWLENTSTIMPSIVQTLPKLSESLKTTIQKFACVTPSVVARDMNSLLLTPKNVNTVHQASNTTELDPFHEARMRLSIQFPDKRLLQYDCGKLQTLDKLLRRLQAGGHRALIFTQMTKVLDILEQFLNIHGHKYLRLDGSTKVEQRQILTDRFNNDTRILAFILSSRSGGLGINLTGADTVIFYDLDWNPAMDKQCQDRCHRIGQTRDVHIYRLVSEHTIEANILRKANQKRMLDDVVIQEGEFTTDYFNKIPVRETLPESNFMDGDAAASAAMDRVLGGPDNNREVQRVIAQAEDVEDVAAARAAEREVVQTDAADFDENAVTVTGTPAAPDTPIHGDTPGNGDLTTSKEEMNPNEDDDLNAYGEAVNSTDEYMLAFMSEQLKDTPVELPRDKSKSKKGRDHRSHRAR